jgi:flavin reductase (DIM6/NTAB) family NADH-FMN oxidoreductase RutF
MMPARAEERAVSFDQRRFRDALGAFPTGVAIITGLTAEGERVGMTVSSFNSVSLDPPLVLFSVGRRANSFAAWCAMPRYAVNILSQQQEELSNRFARSGPDKWAGVLCQDGATGLPVLPNALAVFECEAHARFDGGDHEIFVGRVVALRTSVHRQDLPLLFFGGRYRRLDTRFADELPRDISIFEGW